MNKNIPTIKKNFLLIALISFALPGYATDQECNTDAAENQQEYRSAENGQQEYECEEDCQECTEECEECAADKERLRDLQQNYVNWCMRNLGDFMPKDAAQTLMGEGDDSQLKLLEIFDAFANSEDLQITANALFHLTHVQHLHSQKFSTLSGLIRCLGRQQKDAQEWRTKHKNFKQLLVQHDSAWNTWQHCSKFFITSENDDYATVIQVYQRALCCLLDMLGKMTSLNTGGIAPRTLQLLFSPHRLVPFDKYFDENNSSYDISLEAFDDIEMSMARIQTAGQQEAGKLEPVMINTVADLYYKRALTHRMITLSTGFLYKYVYDAVMLQHGTWNVTQMFDEDGIIPEHKRTKLLPTPDMLVKIKS